ncbi:MAG: hypothetical protein Q8J68_14690 [Methanolobus sp.]|uniref:hypothetical protein n=1 Tax=Methanolobus sp. TaxID=1874737 RepID=UPI0027312590|nr:hypothetical protein [Methanolobus sp.]MDP2218522.1 hypothetical protein [Methanolobus sp.]
MDIEKRKAYNKAYYQTHAEEIKIQHQKHAEEIKAYQRDYRLTHREEGKIYGRNHRLAHYKAMKIYCQSLKGKETKRKSKAKRKQFGFTPLNNYFEGAHGHHIDKEHVIYVPKTLHNDIYHSILKNINMELINTIAYEFLNNKEEVCSNFRTFVSVQ